jgi:outer membrane protein assembly factor BamB
MARASDVATTQVRGRAAALLAGLVMLLATSATATEWPTFAGGPRRLDFNPAETQITAANVAALRVKWRAPVGAALTAAATVATVDVPGDGPTQVVFAPSWDRTLHAVRLVDGSEVWHAVVPTHSGVSYPDVGSAAVATVDGVQRVYWASGQTLYALDAQTGAELWHFSAGTGCLDPPGLCGFHGERNEIEASPLVAGGLVLFEMDVNDRAGGKGGVYAVDAIDGRLVWFFDLEGGMTCRPDPGDDIRRYDGYHTEAELGLPTGFLATRSGCDHPRTPNGCSLMWSSLAYDADRARLFTVSGNCDTDNDPSTPQPPPPMPPFDEAIFALTLDGTPVWRWRPREVDPFDLDFGAVPNLFAIDVDGTPRDVVGVGSKDGTYYVIDREGVNVRTGVRWDDADPSGLPYWATNVVPGGPAGGIIATSAVDEAARRVYFSTAPGTSPFDPQRPTVHALDLDAGTVLWENVAEADADASFAPTSAIPGVVFVGGAAAGNLRAYDAATGALLAKIGVAFPVLASGATVVDGYVLVGSGIGEQSDNPTDPADIVSRLPQELKALCVSGTLACDGDQDGVDFPEDCDDADPQRSPKARELPDDNIDQDCDGLLAYSTDACLAGGSAHQDQRDLAAVLADMEAACPCATFDGGGRRAARAYRACVRGIVRDAIRSKVLRRRCKRLLRQSTCGHPGNVVCCQERIRTGARSCRSRPSARCVDSKRVHRFVEAGVASCAASDCTLDVPTTSTTTSSSTSTLPFLTTTTSTTTTTLPASWAAIHAALIGPACGSCHATGAASGGLGGLEDCQLGHAAMVGVASGQLPALDLVAPGDPAASWLMIKLDGTQSDYEGQCVAGGCGAAMPLNQPLFLPAERDAIRAWILAGAIDDCP